MTGDPPIAPADLDLIAGLIDCLPDPVLLLAGDRHVVAANSAAADLLGGDVVGRDLALALRHPAALEAVARALAGDDPAEPVEISLPVPVGLIFELLAKRLPDGAGSAARVLLVFRDVTLAKGAEKMRADFVANVSHELRSPLTALVGFIETLQGPARDDDEARTHFLSIMDDEAKRMVRLIEDLLSLSKVETNEHLRPEGRVAPAALLRQIAETLGDRARQRDMTIVIEADESLPPIAGDSDQLIEVIHNLVDNAVKYGEPGTAVVVVAKAVDRIPDVGGEGVSIAVRNEGEGIAAEHLPRLTERFYRVDKGRSRSMGGTGLGLAIVKHIVNRHRGRLTIESRPGEGAIFTVYLPAAG